MLVTARLLTLLVSAADELTVAVRSRIPEFVGCSNRVKLRFSPLVKVPRLKARRPLVRVCGGVPGWTAIKRRPGKVELRTTPGASPGPRLKAVTREVIQSFTTTGGG